MSNLPQVASLEFNTDEIPVDLPPIGKSFLYDFDKGEFVFKNGKLIELHGIDSLKMWIMKNMKTAKYRFRIYEGTENGVTIEDLIGMNLPRAYVEAEIKREVTESLLLSPYIDRLESWSFERDGTWMNISFTVISPMYNTFDMEVNA